MLLEYLFYFLLTQFEINASNTIWELLMAKPYRDGGPAIFPRNIEGLKHAVKLYGTLNDPSDVDTKWTVEVAIPWSGLQKYLMMPSPIIIEEGYIMRMNFSRVKDGKYVSEFYVYS
jgi:hypothetical protein